MTYTIKQIETVKNWLSEHVFALADIPTDIGRAKAILSALAVLQKIVAGDDWFEIEDCPHEMRVLMRWHCQYTGLNYEAGIYSRGSRNDLGISNISCHGQATHWKPLCGKQHIKMMLERELIQGGVK